MVNKKGLLTNHFIEENLIYLATNTLDKKDQIRTVKTAF